ncbi:hypothetical protein PC116_g6036, partial [Phytophthora cactorum]
LELRQRDDVVGEVRGVLQLDFWVPLRRNYTS